MALTKLPDVGRIQGLQFQPAPDQEKSTCSLQYTDQTGEQWYEISIPILDALYLLNLLAEMERQQGLRQRNRQDRSVIEGRVARVGFSNKPNTKPLDQQIALEILEDEEQEPWNIRFGMGDAVFAATEWSATIKNFG